ncbi:Nucleoside-diphosphate-sugar epimerase [Agreia bicolorata]|uniref:Nucleoside-diphosphate-sugar epimerase n=1 Tax=Agreia bicolorata TaxID=110935 RepID=A0A1T4YEY8_9MICO|nr:NAD(P)-dependent oxidoreductase [Agreia bicolorata]SKB00263.1 Nucleoside-diphosphate-sugar epimerase [Agreia bicolorata]
MRIFIAGGSGVLGRALIPLLTAAGHDVTATSRSADKISLISRLGATPAVFDALDRDAVFRVVSEARPHVIMHLLTDLSSGDSSSNARLRVTGSRNLVDAAMCVGTHRVIAESISWVYRPGATPATEEEPLDADPAEPRRTTIAAVAALESSVRELPEHVVLRFGQLYGPGTWYSREGRFGRDARAGRLPATDTVTSFIHTSDAARAAVLALAWRSGSYNVVDDEPASGREWVPGFATAVGAPEPAVVRSGDIGRPVSNARARGGGLVLRHASWRDGFASL